MLGAVHDDVYFALRSVERVQAALGRAELVQLAVDVTLTAPPMPIRAAEVAGRRLKLTALGDGPALIVLTHISPGSTTRPTYPDLHT